MANIGKETLIEVGTGSPRGRDEAVAAARSELNALFRAIASGDFGSALLRSTELDRALHDARFYSPDDELDAIEDEAAPLLALSPKLDTLTLREAIDGRSRVRWEAAEAAWRSSLGIGLLAAAS